MVRTEAYEVGIVFLDAFKAMIAREDNREVSVSETPITSGSLFLVRGRNAAHRRITAYASDACSSTVLLRTEDRGTLIAHTHKHVNRVYVDRDDPTLVALACKNPKAVQRCLAKLTENGIEHEVL